MKSGICPKCQQANVVMRENGLKVGGHGLNFNLSILDGVPAAVYVCTDCGYCETYMSDAEVRRSLLANRYWQRVAK